MGYCIKLIDSKFEIKKENFDEALDAIKALAYNHDGTGYPFVKCRYSWVNNNDFIKATSLFDAIEAWGWTPEEKERGGSFSGICLNSEKLGDEEVMFKAIGPYVEKGSYIEMQGEDGARWRWNFDGKKCTQQDAKLVWGGEDE